MSLNEETNSEFIEVEPGMTAPDELPPTQTSQVVIDASPTGDEDNQTALEEIDPNDITLKTTIDGINQYDRLVDVSRVILSAESISRADVQGLFAAMDSEEFASRFTEGVSTLVGFTTSRTRTNLEETQAFIEAELKNTKNKVAEDTKNVIIQVLASLKEKLTKLEENLPGMIERSAQMAKVAIADYDIARNSKSALYYYSSKLVRKTDEGEIPYLDNKLYDIRSLCLDGYPGNDISEYHDGLFRSFKDISALAEETQRLIKRAVTKSNFIASTGKAAVLPQDWFHGENRDYGFFAGSYYALLSLLMSNAITVQLENIQKAVVHAQLSIEKWDCDSIDAIERLNGNVNTAMSFVKKTEMLLTLVPSFLDQFRVILTK